MNSEKLQEILEKHERWLVNDKDGEEMYYNYDFSGEEKYNNETGEWELLGYRLSGVCTIKAVPLLESINELGEMNIQKY